MILLTLLEVPSSKLDRYVVRYVLSPGMTTIGQGNLISSLCPFATETAGLPGLGDETARRN